jgi:hypothetical protein
MAVFFALYQKKYPEIIFKISRYYNELEHSI